MTQEQLQKAIIKQLEKGSMYPDLLQKKLGVSGNEFSKAMKSLHRKGVIGSRLSDEFWR